MSVSVKGPFVRGVAAVALLSLTASGCWLQRGFDAGRGRFVSGTAPITGDNADQLVELWRATGLGSTVGEPVVLGGDVYVTALTTRVSRISASTGAVVYTRALPAPPGGNVDFRIRGLIHHDGELGVGWRVVLATAPGGFSSSGGLVRLAPATGELIEPYVEDEFKLATIDVAEEGGALVEQKEFLATAEAGGGSFGAVAWRGIVATSGVFTGPGLPTTFAVAGDHLVWGLGGTALGWNGTTCSHPDPGGPVAPPFCFADWQTTLGTTLSGAAALGTDAAVYGVDTNRIAVLDAATGAVRFTGTIPGSPAGLVTAPAVAGDTILVGASDGRIAAFPAAGCGQADCAPLWQTTIGTTMTGAPTVVGDVVFATTSLTLVTLRLDGCGAATCPGIATYNLGDTPRAVAYDGGRVFVATNSQLIAFGLPA
jgi:outer membrane protein assembly factor BamB